MLRRITLPLYLLLPLLWLFRRALLFGETFAFRDSAYFYFPFYKYVQQRWSTGIPLWNPLEGLGQPLLGDPTAAVFYPGKLLFTLPIPYATCFAIYIVGHLLLAGLGAYCFARQLKSSRHGAILAGLAYELSGHVLFQHCNPIYLVGAAWLPFALRCFHQITQKDRTTRACLGLGAALSLMVLGGAPQMAVHTVLCSFAWIAICVFDRFRLRAGPGPLPQMNCRNTLVLLGLSCLLAILLAAVQVLPSKEWAGRSDRVVHSVPRSVFELGGQLAAGDAVTLDGFWNRGTFASEHESKIYDFSVGPWRWSELFWPNISGRFGPIPTRWIRGLPGEGRMWSASLYLGLLPVCLALIRFRFWRGSRSVRWISWLALLSMLAAMGEYGLGWILDELRYQTTAEFQPSPVLRGFGGLYWFLTATVPGYIEFRYPAKWWTITSLAISVLAAKGWPLLWSPNSKKLAIRCGGVLVLVLAGTLAVRFLLVREIRNSGAFGPFDFALSMRHLALTLAHVGVVSALIVWLTKRPRTQATICAILGITALEIALAQGWMIPTAPNSNQPDVAQSSSVWPTRGHQYPPEFRTTTSVHRFREMQQHDLDILRPKHHLAIGQRQLQSNSAMKCGDFAEIWKIPAIETADWMMWTVFADSLGALPNSPRAWVVYDWQAMNKDELPSSPRDRAHLVFFENQEKLRNLARIAIVETEDAIPQPSENVSPQEFECEAISTEPERMEYRVNTNSPALLVLREQYYPDWYASISTATETALPAQVHRVNRVMRGVFVPAGESTIMMRYLPRSFYLGAAISFASWIAVCAIGLRCGLNLKVK